jgi:hypothetical protein
VKFTRERVLQTVSTGPTSTTTTVVSPEVSDLLFTNASALDGSTIALPAAFNLDATFEIHPYGAEQIFVHVHTSVLGGGGLTGIDVLIEFENPDWGLSLPVVNRWIPSKEPANSAAGGVSVPLRTDVAALQVWSCIGVGSFIVASRRENQHFEKARVRFRATAGAAGATTAIRCYWCGSNGI